MLFTGERAEEGDVASPLLAELVQVGGDGGVVEMALAHSQPHGNGPHQLGHPGEWPFIFPCISSRETSTLSVST